MKPHVFDTMVAFNRKASLDGWESAYLKACHYPDGETISPDGDVGTCASYNSDTGKCHNIKYCHIDGEGVE